MRPVIQKLDVMIPTIKRRAEIQSQIDEIQKHTTRPHRIIASCQQGISAAKNRNLCLEYARGEFLIMVDDDISGFYPGWEDALLAPLAADPLVCMVSARLMNPDGSIGPMCNVSRSLSQPLVEVGPRRDCVLPSAAIAFRNVGLSFDERFVGSGFEDGDFCFQFIAANKGSKFLVNNRCRLVHGNEAKHQYNRECWDQGCTLYTQGILPKCRKCYFQINRAHFWKKWNVG
jgi:glycosyltransferase involved in cell wall biosynthesis